MSRPRIALAIALALACAAAADPAPPQDPRTLTYTPLTIAFPEPRTLRMDNGLIVHLFVDRELPIVDLAFYMKAGAIYDSPDRAGLAEIAMFLMRTGGTRDMTPDEIDAALEFMPATAHLSADLDIASGSLSALSKDFPEALRIFAGMLRAPRFDEERLDLAKARSIEGIRRRWDDPADIADLNFRALVYGRRSPWARLETAATIGSIDRGDLEAFHRRYVHPNNMVMGIAGDFDPAGMRALLERTFGSWRRAKVNLPPVADLERTAHPGVHLIERPLNQTTLAIGHLGANRFDRDKFPLKILSHVLGEGGFSSRLVKEIRSSRGLAYSIGGGVGVDSDRGLFQITGQTRADATVEAIQAVREIADDLREHGPTEEELQQAKDASINSFVFSMEGTARFMRAYLYYEAYGYPRDFLETYRDRIAAVTRAQVRRAARKHIQPDRLVILAVGNPADFDRPLTALDFGEPQRWALQDGGAEKVVDAPLSETAGSAPP